MNADLEVAYLGVEVADPTAFGEFLANIVGLVPGKPTSDGAMTWRNDERVHRLLVKSGPANDAAFVGFEATSRDAYERAVERVRPTSPSRRHAAGGRRAGRQADRFDTPWGGRSRSSSYGRRRRPFDCRGARRLPDKGASGTPSSSNLDASTASPRGPGRAIRLARVDLAGMPSRPLLPLQPGTIARHGPADRAAA